MPKYSLIEVKTDKQKRLFLDMVNSLYVGYDNYVRPLDNDLNKVFDPTKNTLFADGKAIRWIAQNDETGQIVGRIAAFYSAHLAAENIEQPTGGCGFFESINDQEVANMLFDAARQFLQQQGMEAMDGPINFGDRDQWWGLLVDGFARPVYGMNFNHIYYKELMENYGFQNYYYQYSFSRNIADTYVSDIVVEKARRLKENPDYSFRHINKADLKQVGKDFRAIYNKAWAGFNGVAEMTQQQTDNMLKNLKPIIDERLIFFAYYKGEPIGFFVMVPDINGAIRHLNGKFGLWQKLLFFYHLKIRKSCNIALGLIFAVTPEHQGKGIESGMMEAFKLDLEKSPSRYKTLELVWVGDFNPLMIRMVETYVLAKRIKTHATYRYLFDRTKEFTRAPRVSRSKKVEAAQL